MKKGISPLVSSILLILFTIVLFSVVVKFSSNTVDESLETSGNLFEKYQNCEEIQFRVMNAYCDERDLLLVNIENEKDIDFKDNFVVKLYYNNEENEVGTFLYDTRLNAYEVKNIAIARTKEKGTGILGEEVEIFKAIQKLEIIPKVQAGESFSFCTDKKIEIEVKNCLRKQA